MTWSSTNEVLTGGNVQRLSSACDDRAVAEELTNLAARTLCPACGAWPLSAADSALRCEACGRQWPVASKRPLAVRLALENVEARAEDFRPPPPARSPLRRAIREWHAEHEARFAPKIPALPESQARAIRAAFVGEGRVLDVGGRSGRWRALLGRPRDYTIVDVAPPETLPLEPDVTYVLADAAALPFADATFDLVLMVEVLHHLPDPGRALAEAGRVLDAAGVFVLTTRQAWRPLGAPSDYFRFTSYGLDRLLDASGLRRERLVPLGGPASVAIAALENNLPLLTKPLAQQLLSHQLWRLAALLDRTVFREAVAGPAPDVPGWLVVARR
jgi:SAM-dependent methyltransferase